MQCRPAVARIRWARFWTTWDINTKLHFAREEKFFAQTGYPGALLHKQEHDNLTRQVVDVQHKYAAGASATLSLDVLHFLKDWLIQHIQGSDQKYRPHLNAKGLH